jgi:spore maturation protein CgeB
MESAIPEYDCIFDTKRFWDDGLEKKINVRHRTFLPHGYDLQLHRPIPLSEKDHEDYACDVSFIGTYSPRKEPILKRLVQTMPELKVKIWGSSWLRYNRSAELRPYIQGEALLGDRYVKAILASRINLAIMGITESFKDETTTRTYEIPACGGFMLHERTAEVQELFVEGKEIECFDSTTELVKKIQHYLAHPEEREAIARAGYARCVPAYSYDQRMAEILKWHEEHKGNRG